MKRLFNLLKNILTLGNRFYCKVGTYNMAATAQDYLIGSMTISKAGTYLILAIADHNFAAPNKIMGLGIAHPSGAVKQITGTYTTRTTADSGGGLTNFRLVQLSAGAVIEAHTYNYTGVAGRIDYSLVAIRLLAGGGDFIGSPVRRWAYEAIYNTLATRRSYKNRLKAYTDRGLSHPVGQRDSYNNTICKRRILVHEHHADISRCIFRDSSYVVTGQFGWRLHQYKLAIKPNNFKRIYKTPRYQNTRDNCAHLLARHRSGIDWGCVA